MMHLLFILNVAVCHKILVAPELHPYSRDYYRGILEEISVTTDHTFVVLNYQGSYDYSKGNRFQKVNPKMDALQVPDINATKKEGRFYHQMYRAEQSNAIDLEIELSHTYFDDPSFLEFLKS